MNQRADSRGDQARRPEGGPRPPARAKTRNVARRDADPARQVAWRTLRAVHARDAYANLELLDQLRFAGLEGRDAAFATELAYGALRSQGTYDAVLGEVIDRPLSDVDPDLLDALRLGAHQLLGMRVPTHAAVAATVDLVRADVGQGPAGFANAVLRRVAAHDLPAWLDRVAPAGGDADEALGVRFSHPVWVVRALRDALLMAGRPVAELPDLLDADNARPEVTLAALPGLADVAELAGSPGVAAGRWSPYAVTVTGRPDRIEAVGEGRARVQDEGSQLVALAAAEAPLTGPDGGRWLDLCAGPGGKAAVWAALLRRRRDAGTVPGAARLVANEVTAHRVGLVRGSLAAVLRAAPGLVEVRQGDGREIGAAEPGAYDRVLLDAPCTGLGALRRRPEARWRRTPQDVGQLADLQRELLTSALDAVRPGGVVAYVTCSPHPAETRLVVSDVLKKRSGVERLDARIVLTAALERELPDLGDGPDVQLWPHRHGCDAMYLALLRRSG